MSITESTSRRLALMSGSTSLTLDKDAGQATMQRKFLFWKLKPAEAPLTDITAVTVDKAVDRASGVEMFSTVLVTRGGAGWALPANDSAQAERNATAIRSFLGIST